MKSKTDWRTWFESKDNEKAYNGTLFLAYNLRSSDCYSAMSAVPVEPHDGLSAAASLCAADIGLQIG